VTIGSTCVSSRVSKNKRAVNLLDDHTENQAIFGISFVALFIVYDISYKKSSEKVFFLKNHTGNLSGFRVKCAVNVQAHT